MKVVNGGRRHLARGFSTGARAHWRWSPGRNAGHARWSLRLLPGCPGRSLNILPREMASKRSGFFGVYPDGGLTWGRIRLVCRYPRRIHPVGTSRLCTQQVAGRRIGPGLEQAQVVFPQVFEPHPCPRSWEQGNLREDQASYPRQLARLLLLEGLRWREPQASCPRQVAQLLLLGEKRRRGAQAAYPLPAAQGLLL